MKHYRCPNPDCQCHTTPPEHWYVKDGYYKTKHNYQKVPRYKCKHCGKTFSSNTFKDTYKQHKPELNNPIFNFYASNVSQNRLAVNLKCNVKTIVRKIKYLAYKARIIHEHKLNNGELKVGIVQFDEMETFEQTRMKPVAIAIAVESYWDDEKRVYRTGRIIDAIAAPMYYRGIMAKKAQEKYGDREDRGLGARVDVVESVKKAANKPNIKILTDGKRSYGNLFTGIMPAIKHEIITRKQNSASEVDRMFSLNHTCARLRHDMSRMTRKSWVTTKSVDALQEHIDLYIAYFNNYVLC